MESPDHNCAKNSKTIFPEMLIFGMQASWALFFQNILTNPIISQINFYDVITLELFLFFLSPRSVFISVFRSCSELVFVLGLNEKFRPTYPHFFLQPSSTCMSVLMNRKPTKSFSIIHHDVQFLWPCHQRLESKIVGGSPPSLERNNLF